MVFYGVSGDMAFTSLKASVGVGNSFLEIRSDECKIIHQCVLFSTQLKKNLWHYIAKFGCFDCFTLQSAG